MNALNKTDFEEICRACLARFTEFRPTSIIQPEMFIVFLKTELVSTFKNKYLNLFRTSANLLETVKGNEPILVLLL